jgi:cellulose synthase/poly-beta-1,6-N-acetylglucosamine synthase-like glycosyltransferase/peptidoglycan/xylan/chitin deacetylase (PgdA/CDA1 family)
VCAIGRHARFNPRRRTFPVFSSKSGRRGFLILLIMLALGAGLVLSIVRAQQLAGAVPRPPAHHAGIAYPRQLANEMAACGRKHGELVSPGKRGIPIIGSGVFRRVVELRRAGGRAYAIDPFSGRTVISQLTPVEIQDMRGCSYAIEQFGQVPARTLLLTYDDGPDKTWTPRLLAVLKAYGVRATFFNVGMNILHATEALRQIVASGNVAANHTLTHPEMNTLSPAAARSEILLDYDITVAVADYRSLLYRTPYSGNNLTENLFSTLVAQQMGFTDVGYTLDTLDYTYRPGARIPLPKFGGPGLPGQLLVMHDTGGKNDVSTVRLTERIIEKAQALGYRFMTVDQLLRQQGVASPVQLVRPTLGDQAGYWLSWADLVALQSGVPLFLNVAAGVVIAFGLIWIGRALYEGVKQNRPVPGWYPGLVSVLIAAKDEKAVIRSTIASVFAYSYPFDLQVVVVNDGSTDGAGGTADGAGGTKAILDELAAQYRRPPRQLEVIHLEHNVGKSAAWDLAFRTRVRGEVCVAFDADTELTGPDTIPNLVRHFRDPSVGAVAGYIKARNTAHQPWKWALCQFQQAEYNIGIGMLRVGQGRHGIMVVPGACSAWRTSAMRRIGMAGDTVGEDADAGLDLREAGFLVVQDIKAVAVTQIPDTLRGIARQWLRWSFGAAQNVWKHKRIMLQVGRYGALTWVMWYAVISMLIPLVVLPLSYAAMGLAIAMGRWSSVWIYLTIFTGFRLVQNFTAMVVLREWAWDPVTAVFYRFINDPLQIYLAYRTLFAMLTGRLIGWKGTRVVRAPAIADNPPLRAA